MEFKSEFSFGPWNVTENAFELEHNYRDETIFSLGNGYIGTRGTMEESENFGDGMGMEGTFLNGFYESEPIRYGEFNYGFPSKSQTMLNVPNAKIINLEIDGESFNMLSGKTENYKRTLCLDKGILERSQRWTSKSGKVLDIVVKRLVSFVEKHLMAISYQVTPVNFSGVMDFVSTLDGDVINHTAQTNPLIDYGPYEASLIPVSSAAKNETLKLVMQVKNNRFYLCTAARNVLSVPAEIWEEAGEKRASVRYTVEAHQGEAVTLTKYIAYASDELDCSQTERTTEKTLDHAVQLGFSAIEAAQTLYLKSFWNHADVEIVGDDAVQQGIRFNLFHVLQSTGRDGSTGVGAKGLSGEGYEGHYFWDTEMYVNPLYTHTIPEYSKKLLEFRYRTLDAARAHARELGHPKGALYPWRTINGREASAYYPLGSAQYHINGDVAYAVNQYVRVSGDEDFMSEMGAEILCETARVWADVGHFSPYKGGKYVINCVTGPDEYNAIVDNNFYTNLMARENLRSALYWLNHLKERPEALRALTEKIDLLPEETLLWKEIADKMYLGFDEKLGIFPQDDTFLQKKPWKNEAIPPEKRSLLYVNYHPLFVFRHQMCKQADTLLGMLLNEHQFSKEELQRNYDFYSKVTLHHSSLSKCIFGVIECRLKKYDAAYTSFMKSVRADLDDPNNNVYMGIHIANMAGTWMTIVNGFAGMSTTDGTLRFKPYLPHGWKSYRFRITYRGSLLQVYVCEGRAEYCLLEGKNIHFWHGCREATLHIGEDSLCFPLEN